MDWCRGIAIDVHPVGEDGHMVVGSIALVPVESIRRLWRGRSRGEAVREESRQHRDDQQNFEG